MLDTVPLDITVQMLKKIDSKRSLDARRSKIDSERRNARRSELGVTGSNEGDVHIGDDEHGVIVGASWIF